MRTALINAKKVLTEKRGGGSLAARGLCHVLQLSPLELGAVGTPVRVRGAAGALSSPEALRKGPVLHTCALLCIAPADPAQSFSHYLVKFNTEVNSLYVTLLLYQ